MNMVTTIQAEIDPRENMGMDIEMANGDIVISSNNDFSIIKYNNNLGQAVKNRLSTVIGELKRNPNYGSELPLYLGIGRNESLLPQLNSAVFRTLQQEPRIQEVIEVNSEFDEIDKTKVNISISILPIDYIEPLNLVYELFV